jgi:hypothetical protein
MTLLHPDRVVAAWLRSGVPLLEAVEGRTIQPHELPEAALQVPIMCNLGIDEGVRNTDGQFAGVWPANQTFFHRLRDEGALIAVAIDPLSSHECGNQRYLAIPWFDAILTARLPESDGELLRPMPTQDAWLVPLHTGEADVIAAVPAAEFTGDIASSIWLPNEAVATAWMQYVRDTEVTDITPPPAPTDVELQGNELTWDAVADLESGLAQFVIERNGEVIATIPEAPANPFGRPVFQGLQYSDTPTAPLVEMRFTLDAEDPDEFSEYHIRAVNTVGLMSE